MTVFWHQQFIWSRPSTIHHAENTDTLVPGPGANERDEHMMPFLLTPPLIQDGIQPVIYNDENKIRGDFTGFFKGGIIAGPALVQLHVSFKETVATSTQ